MPKIIRKQRQPIDSYTGKPYTPPASPFKSKTLSTYSNNPRKIKSHPSWGKFNKKYPNVDAWIMAHPGIPIGRSLESAPVIYYSYYLRYSPKYDRDIIRFSWDGSNPPKSKKGYKEYDSFTEWKNAMEKAYAEIDAS